MILTGAGISADAGLPDGQQLARLAFRAVSEPVVLPDRCRHAITAALSWHRSREPALRLELLLELMSRDLPLEVLAGVYSAVARAVPTRTHAAIVASGLASITANQDQLLEAATGAAGSRTAPTVLHLHGIASMPSTIMTTIGQYSAGLPHDVQQRFTDLVAGQHLLVAGYSGRDLDIMPTLYTAGRITWLHWHKPGRTPGPLATEAERLRKELGPRFTVVPVSDLTGWITRRLPPADRRRVATWPTSTHARTALSQDAQDAFEALPNMDRHIAVARILMHVNRPRTALDILTPWVRGRSLHARAALRAAEAQQMLGDSRAALRLYQRAVDRADDVRVEASAWLGVAHIHANTGRYPEALHDLDRMDDAARLVTNRRHRLDAQIKASAARGRIQTSTGDDLAAARSYRRAIDAATRNGHLDQRLNALVMGADVYRSAGRPLMAITQLDEAFADNTIYTRPYSRVWAHYYRGLARCASGDLAGGGRDLLDCLARARASRNLQAIAWAQVTLSSFRLHDDLAASRRYADDCEDTISTYGRMPLCRIRLEWHRAEIARASGDHHAARDLLQPVQRHLRDDPDTYGAPYMIPYVQAMHAELARSESRDDTITLLDHAVAGFRRGGWRQQVVRMLASRWLYAGRGDMPPRALLQRCLQNGYGLELNALQAGDRSSYLPLHPL